VGLPEVGDSGVYAEKFCDRCGKNYRFLRDPANRRGRFRDVKRPPVGGKNGTLKFKCKTEIPTAIKTGFRIGYFY
jgi:hypothetical protein